MKSVYLTRKQLYEAFDGLPTKNDLAIACCNIPEWQENGIPTYERKTVAEALAKFYRRQAADNWEKHKRPHKGEYKGTTFYANRAQRYRQKAVAVEDLLMTWKAEEGADNADNQAQL